MKISLQFEPLVVDDGNGNVLFEAPLFDLSLLIGSIVTQAVANGIDRNDNIAIFSRVAEALNEKYKIDKLTYGSASEISQEVNNAINELKKNGKLLAPLAQS